MTESGRFWSGRSVGDATVAPYSHEEWSAMFRKLFLDNRNVSGVIQGYLNEFSASGVSTPITIASGGAFIDGTFYESDANTDFTIASPSANPRIDRIVIRKDSSAQTVRLVAITGTEAATPSAPDLTQTEGVTWDIPLWQLFIDTSGNITPLDEFHYARTPSSSRYGEAQGRLTTYLQNPTEFNQTHFSNSAFDAGNDTVTFNDPYPNTGEWVTGQAIQTSVSDAGFSTSTAYFVNAIGSNEYSFHTTYHDAINDLNRVNVTGDPSGWFYSAGLYYARYVGVEIAVWDATNGFSKRRIPTTEYFYDITSLSDNTNYDVFFVGDELYLLAWTDATTRATELEWIDGIYYLDGDRTKRYLGTVRVDGSEFSGTSFGSHRIEDAPQRRLVWNYYNRLYFGDTSLANTSTWNVSSNAAWVAAEAGASWGLHEILVGVKEHENIHSRYISSVTEGQNEGLHTAILDSSLTLLDFAVRGQTSQANVSTFINPLYATLDIFRFSPSVDGVGVFDVQAAERSDTGDTTTTQGTNNSTQTGIFVCGWR